MDIDRFIRKEVALLVGLIATGTLPACGGSSSSTVTAKDSASATVAFSVESYLPLIDNTVLSFETEAEGATDRGLLVMQIRRPRPALVELSIGGKKHRLELLKEGVRVVESGWLLKTPLEVGATFKGQYGTVKVTQVNVTVQVPAGRFKGCLETEETTGTSRTLTRFCPTIGITELEIESLSTTAPGREVARLKSHGTLVDLGKDQLKVSQ